MMCILPTEKSASSETEVQEDHSRTQRSHHHHYYGDDDHVAL